MTTLQQQRHWERTSSARHAKVGDAFKASPTAKPQKPYANGVVVWNDSGSSGRGFAYTAKIAVREDVIVGVYFSEYTRRRAEVQHPMGMSPIEIWTDYEYGNGRITPYVTRTALSKWVEAVKAL